MDNMLLEARELEECLVLKEYGGGGTFPWEDSE